MPTLLCVLFHTASSGRGAREQVTLPCSSEVAKGFSLCSCRIFLSATPSHRLNSTTSPLVGPWSSDHPFIMARRTPPLKINSYLLSRDKSLHECSVMIS